MGRLNALSEVIKALLTELLLLFEPAVHSEEQSVLDTLTIITCSGKGKGRMTRALTHKGHCSLRGIYYYGLKLHALGWIRGGGLPAPEALVSTPASENDLNVLRQCRGEMEKRMIYGDKIYHDGEWFARFRTEKGSEMLTPVKAVKGMAETRKQFNKAGDDMFSTGVSP